MPPYDRLRRQVDELERLLKRGEGPASREDLLAVAAALRGVAANLERARRRHAEMESRLLAIENSRFFQWLRLPGRLLLDWRGRLGQWLLHSPLHPLYLKTAKPAAAIDEYQGWVARERPPEPRTLRRRPLISVVLPVHNPRREWLEAAVQSVLDQTYGGWQLCVCDDASAEPWVAAYFTEKAAAEPRIRFARAPENLGISGASNRALELADGEYAGFLDQDDRLAPWALQCVAEAVDENQADLLYSDEDYIDEAGRRVQPVFKPAWSPDLLRCCMYMGHFLVARRAALERAGGLRSACDGSQDYDLALRMTQDSAAVRHIPRVLYHWRRHPASTAAAAAAKPYAQAAGLRALSEAVAAREPAARVEPGAEPNSFRVRRPVPSSVEASLIVCSRNPRLLERCLRAIDGTTAHRNREIVVVEHLMNRPAADYVRVPYSGAFHFAKMNNLGAARASGDVLVFLNDDVRPLAPEWLDELMAHVLRPEIGVAGARLLYPSGAIQHAGMAIGIMQGAGHLHRDTFGARFWNWLPFTRNVSAVTGACLAIRKAVFDQLGGFDEAFPVNYNDVDLCLRARAAGYEVIVEPAAVLRHDECRTRQAGVRSEERELLEDRWAGPLERGDPFYSPHLTRTREDASLSADEPGNLAAR